MSAKQRKKPARTKKTGEKTVPEQSPKIVLPAFGLAADILAARPDLAAADQAPAAAPAGTARSGGTGAGRDTSPGRESEGSFHLVGFLLHREEYGVDIGHVQEIIHLVDIRRIPNAPPFLLGVINYRGRVISVLDLRRRLDMQAADVTSHSRIIVIESGPKLLGLLVDRVTQVLRVPAAAVGMLPEEIEPFRGFVRGIAKLDARLVMVLDMDRLMTSEYFSAGEGAEHGASRPAAGEPRHDADGPGTSNADGEEAEFHFVSFRLDREEYGIDIGGVQEIIRVGRVTPVPNAPHFVEGVISLRGRIIPVINLRKRLGLADSPPTRNSRIIITESGAKVLGLLVDGVAQVIRFPASVVEEPPDDGEAARMYVWGIAKVGSRLVMAMDLERVLAKENRPAGSSGT
jgi:purine-binding chemotaxis protein CheW